MVKSHNGRKCRVVGCPNNKKSPPGETCLFRIQNVNSELFEQWVQASGVEEALHIPIKHIEDNFFFCDLHFLPQDIVRGKSRTTLKRGVVPTLFAVNHVPLSEEKLQQWRQYHHYVAYSEEHQSWQPNTVPKVGVQDVYITDEIGVCLSASDFATSDQVVAGGNSCGTELHHVPVPPSRESGLMILETAGDQLILKPYDGVLDGSTVEPVATRPEPSSTPTSSSAPQPLCSSPEEILAQPLPDSSPTGKPSDTFIVFKKRRRSGTGPIIRRNRPSVATKRRTQKLLMQELGAGGAEITPIKKGLLVEYSKVKAQLEQLRNDHDQLKALQDVDNLDAILEHVVSPQLRLFVVSNVRNHDKPGPARRWTLDEKLQALSIFKRSPKGYRYLSYILCLPSVRTLQRLLQLLPMTPGINHTIIKHAAKSIDEKDPKDKCVILMFDEMFIKKRLMYNPVTGLVEGFADFGIRKNKDGEEYHHRENEMSEHALVFMVQGLSRRYKQPVGFHFVGKTARTSVLQELIKEYIVALEESGFHVMATVCDQGATNRAAIHSLMKQTDGGEGLEGLYFKVVERKVWPLFDVPHLFKNLRTNFMKSKRLVWNRRTAKYSDIVRAYVHDRGIFRCRKLTLRQLQPKGRELMSVGNAVKTLSNTTSSFLVGVGKAAHQGRLLPKFGFVSTGLVVREFDRLFDATNGPSGPKEVIRKRRENVTAGSFHSKVWKHMIRKMDKMTMYDSHDLEAKPKPRLPCQEGFIHTLRNLENLWQTLRSEYGFRFLNLRQLNQDPLENLFGVIRQHGATCDNPTVGHFVAALKTSIITNLTAYHSRGSNVEADDGELISDLRDLLQNGTSDEAMGESSNQEADDHVDVDVINCVLGTDNPRDRLKEFLHEQDMASNLTAEDLEGDLCDLEALLMLGKSHVAGYIGRKISEKLDCEFCRSSLSAKERTDLHAFTAEKEYNPDRPGQFYASPQFCRLVADAEDSVQVAVVEGKKLFQTNVKSIVHEVIMMQDFSWIDCTLPGHFSIVSSLISDRLCTMLLRTICKRQNEDIRAKEEAVKKAREAERLLSKEERARKNVESRARKAARKKAQEEKEKFKAELRRKKRAEKEEEAIALKEMKRLERLARREGLTLDGSTPPRKPTRAEVIIAKSSSVWNVTFMP